MEYKNIGFTISKLRKCGNQEKFLSSYGYQLIENFSDLKKKKIDLLFVLGGDGFMLRVLHKAMNTNVHFFGVNCGTNGFLLNNPKYLFENDLESLIKNSQKYIINPLKAKIISSNGVVKITHAINEISLLRSTHNTSHIKILIDDEERLDNLIGDGIIAATPVGSTAYNLSLNGPILPLNSNFLAITPISPFRPRLWKGAIVNDSKKITFEVNENHIRPVNVTADFLEFRNVAKVEIITDKSREINMLFNTFENIDEKIIGQQFHSDCQFL